MASRATVLIATTNAGKLREIRELLGGVAVDLASLADFPAVPEPEETGTTFEENARLKARYYARRVAPDGILTVAEDSGLAIDALDGEPGVHSARFLRPDASYPERFAEIERRLRERPDAARTARFVCALAAAAGDHVVYETRGVIEGEIAWAPAGDAGFGYDPIFYYPPYGQTLAQVTQARKLAVAHRGQAFTAFAAWLRTRN